jgi:hypothetical protein
VENNFFADFGKTVVGSSNDRAASYDFSCNYASGIVEDPGGVADCTAFATPNSCLGSTVSTGWINSVETSFVPLEDLQHQDVVNSARGSFVESALDCAPPQYVGHQLLVDDVPKSLPHTNISSPGNNFNRNSSTQSSNSLVSPPISDDVGYASQSTTPASLNVVEDLDAILVNSEVVWEALPPYDSLLEDVDGGLFVLDDGTEVQLIGTGTGNEQEMVLNTADCLVPVENKKREQPEDESIAYAAGSSSQNCQLLFPEPNNSTADSCTTTELDTFISSTNHFG